MQLVLNSAYEMWDKAIFVLLWSHVPCLYDFLVLIGRKQVWYFSWVEHVDVLKELLQQNLQEEVVVEEEKEKEVEEEDL